jgi:hypothetical protein
MNSPRDASGPNLKKEQFVSILAMLGAIALFLWALCVLMGTGIGYDHPIFGLFDGGVLAATWRLTKAIFLGVLALATIRTAIYSLEEHMHR